MPHEPKSRNERSINHRRTKAAFVAFGHVKNRGYLLYRRLEVNLQLETLTFQAGAFVYQKVNGGGAFNEVFT